MSIRLTAGNDAPFRWAVKLQGKPFDLSGKDVKVYVINSRGEIPVARLTIEGNEVSGVFEGRYQTRLGEHSLILRVNEGRPEMKTAAVANVFELVQWSADAGGSDEGDVIVAPVLIESELSIGGSSYDDTEIRQELTKLSERIEENEVLIEDLQNTKIDKEADDYYPQLAVGLADNLSGVDVVDSEVNFRRSGGGAISDGVARIEAIKGNSVVWNQWAKPFQEFDIKPSSSDYTFDENNVIIVNWNAYAPFRTNIKASYAISHQYLILFNYANTNPDQKLLVQIGGEVSKSFTSGYVVSFYQNSGRDGGYKDYLSLYCTEALEGTITLSNLQVIDLTQMFGAGNEPTTIDEFYARIPMGVDLNAYNEGEVIHMDVQSIESQGVNAWDEEWEVGRYSLSTGAAENASNFIRSKNAIKVIPNTQYYITLPYSNYWISFFEYDAKGNFLRNRGSIAKLVTTSADCEYVRFFVTAAYGTTYNHDICINLSDTSINGKYFPYIKRVEDLSIIRKYFPQGMKSAGSAHDEIRYNEETNRWEMVEAIGTRAYQEGDADNASYLTDGKVTCYPLAEPIVTELDAEDQFKDLDYQVWNCGTEKAIAEGKSAPLAADITYGFNAIGKIKELESLVAALRAKVGI